MNRGFAPLILILVTLVVITLSVVGYKAYQKTIQRNATTQVKRQIVTRRSQPVGKIVQATTAKQVDPNTGKVIVAARIFSLADKTIYLALDLNNPVVGSHIDYIRYLAGRYIDHGEVHIDKPNTKFLIFNWGVKTLNASHPDGQYRVATYYQGILEKRVNYEVRNNKITALFIEPGDGSSLASALRPGDQK